MTTTNATGTAHTATASTEALCSVCGQPGTDPVQRADLATTWLVPHPNGAPATHHFCRGCAPTGPVEDITCIRCGDGPLVSGELTIMDLHATAAVDECLTTQGWQLSGPVCPSCLHDVAR